MFREGSVKKASRQIYADCAATTAMSKEVLEAMIPYFSLDFGNASTLYERGRIARQAVNDARKRVAAALGAEPEEIFFTSGGSESDNWAIKGVAESWASRGKKHIITSAIEHPAVLRTTEFLSQHGFSVTYLAPNASGRIDPGSVEQAVREDTALVSIMFVNNEIGTIQPISEIGAICKRHGILFHTDAVQAVGHVPLDVKKLHVDLLSLSGHKFHGPKGTGVLYVRQGTLLSNLIHGGGQESGRRAGTENVPGITGLATAICLATQNIPEKTARLTPLRDWLLQEIQQIEGAHINGDTKERVAGNIHVSFEGVEGESLVLLLDQYGIQASSGSACHAGSLAPSHVLEAIGVPPQLAKSSLRLSFDETFSAEDAAYLLNTLRHIIQRLRKGAEYLNQ